MWKMIASGKANKNLSKNLTDKMQHKDSGFYNSKTLGSGYKRLRRKLLINRNLFLCNEFIKKQTFHKKKTNNKKRKKDRTANKDNLTMKIKRVSG